MQNAFSPQQQTIRNRLPWVILVLVIGSAVLLFQLANFQFLPPEVAREFQLRAEAGAGSIRRLPAKRGIIYDRDGQPLAFNTLEYRIGISPNLISDPFQVANDLAAILNLDELDMLEIARSDVSWDLISERPVSAETWQAIDELDILGITSEPIARRFYPQGALAGQVIGFMIEADPGPHGAIGIEGFYNDELAGRVLDQEVSNIPFDLPEETQDERQRGRDIVLTIDRDIQYWVESELLLAVNESGSRQGTILVMDPHNGDILAMASYPSFDPNNFVDVADPSLLNNPAISEIYEPGSVMKILTVAGALEKGVVTPDWTYNDQGLIEVGGRKIENWDNRAHGSTDTTQVLVQSLNVGVTTIALEMGTDDFYSMLSAFGIGRRTGIDLTGEENGILKVPGDPNWSESDLATNSFGQGVSVTPLQMITATAAIANDGLMYQPRLIKQIVDGDEVINPQPLALGRPISAATANTITEMMVRVVEEGATDAALAGYTIAGKTGTAEIPTPLGYEPEGPNSSIVTFVGFLPADDPKIVVLVKLDRPDGYWGSIVAAPVFRRLAERLVILLEIPLDEARHALADSGASGREG